MEPVVSGMLGIHSSVHEYMPQSPQMLLPVSSSFQTSVLVDLFWCLLIRACVGTINLSQERVLILRQVLVSKVIRSCAVLTMLMELYLLLVAQTHLRGYINMVMSFLNNIYFHL